MAEETNDPTDPSIERESSPVGVPHWQALKDIYRILPCEVNPVNSDRWIKVVKSEPDENSDQIVLIAEDGERLYSRDIHDPILCRTTDASAEKLRWNIASTQHEITKEITCQQVNQDSIDW